MDINRISACSYCLREHPYAYALQVIADAGCVKADLWGRDPHFPEDPTDEVLTDLEAVVERTGVKIANIGSYPGREFGSGDPAAVEAELAKMRKIIDAAARLGARSIRVSPGHDEDPAIIERVAPPMAQSAAYAAARGVYLGMENHRGSIAGNPEHSVMLCEAVGNPHFGVLYEPCNLLAIEVDFREAFEVMRDHIVHCHLKDGAWTADGFKRCHLGEGEVDPAWVTRALEGIGYQGDYALEYEIPNIEPMESGLKKWVEYFLKV